MQGNPLSPFHVHARLRIDGQRQAQRVHENRLEVLHTAEPAAELRMKRRPAYPSGERRLADAMGPLI